MKKIVKIKESELVNLIDRIITESTNGVKTKNTVSKPKPVVNEGKQKKIYYHILEYGDYGDIGYQGVYDTKEEADKRIASLSDMFPNIHFELFIDTSRKEPPITTV